eukprot:scaffold78886_cov51-Attheya_sp.AAC.2
MAANQVNDMWILAQHQPTNAIMTAHSRAKGARSLSSPQHNMVGSNNLALENVSTPVHQQT